MKSYLKFLSRNKLYTAIEAVGLIVSLAFIIIIATSVHDQRRLSRPGPGQENLYLLGNAQSFSAEYRSLEALAAMPEVEKAAAFRRVNMMAKVGGENVRTQLTVADPSLLEMIPLDVRSGSLDLFEAGPGVLITESAARKYFPGRDPLGEEVLFGDVINGREGGVPTPVRIVAVVEDPSFTLLDDFDFMVSIECPTGMVRRIHDSNLRQNYSGYMIQVLAKMVPEADLTEFSRKYAAEVLWFTQQEDKEGLLAIPYEDLFFSDIDINGLRQGKWLYLVVLILLGLILLASAVLNYVSLSLAASGFRAKEMATRQLVGDDRRGVLMRSLGESLLFVGVCYVLAVLLTQALVPLLNSLRPEGMTVSFRVAPDGHFSWMSVLLVLGVGALAGLAPASMLASWRPIDVVSGRLRRRRKMVFNRICIIVQAALALVLIVMAITLHAQLRYLQTLDLGISPAENVYSLGVNLPLSDEVLRDRIASSPLVEEVGSARGFPTHCRITGSFTKEAMLRIIQCDSTAFRLLGFRVQEIWGGLASGMVWLTEEAKNYLGDSREAVETAFMSSRYVDRTMTGVGGVVEEYRKKPVNGEDPFDESGRQMLSVVRITEPDFFNGNFIIRTSPDHAAFKRFIRETVNAYYREREVFGDVFSDEMNFIDTGYLDEVVAKDYDDLARYVRLVEIFCLMAVLLAMLGLVAMSTYYAGTRSKDIAIRKVFGGTVDSEAWKGVRSYMLWVALAAVIGVPAGVFAARRFLEGWPERISGYWWIFVVSVLLILLISFLAVLWQTLKAARTNPAVELKKE